MRTVVLGAPPPELEELIARRRATGLDRHDEVWEGEYHMAPAASPGHAWLQTEVLRRLDPLAERVGLAVLGELNLGVSSHDFRVPDLCLYEGVPATTFVPWAPMIVEILSPDDETVQKLDFYADRGVAEVLIVSGSSKSVTWLVLRDGRYVESEYSELLGPESAGLSRGIRWPDTGVSAPP
jgi:Uma2 family endonuclease